MSVEPKDPKECEQEQREKEKQAEEDAREVAENGPEEMR